MVPCSRAREGRFRQGGRGVRRMLAVLAAALLPAAAVAQEYLVGGYMAYIGPDDLYNSNGVRLTDAVSVLRQDRANVHRFGIAQPGDERDDWFGSQAARGAMARMFAAGGGIHPEFQRMIVNGGVPVYVTIYAVDGSFTKLRAEVPG